MSAALHEVGFWLLFSLGAEDDVTGGGSTTVKLFDEDMIDVDRAKREKYLSRRRFVPPFIVIHLTGKPTLDGLHPKVWKVCGMMQVSNSS